MRDRQCALNHDAIESAPIVWPVINKLTMLSCVYHLFTDDLLWQNFPSPQCRNCSRDPDHAHLGNTHSSQDLRLHMADPCTKFEISSVSHCGDITWGVNFYKGSPNPDHGKIFHRQGGTCYGKSVYQI